MKRNESAVESFLAGVRHEAQCKNNCMEYLFSAECRGGKSYSVRIEVTADDDCGIQCEFPLSDSQKASVNAETLRNLNSRLHMNRTMVTVFVEDGCAIASTGTSGEIFNEKSLALRLASVLEAASQLDLCLARMDQG